MPGMTRTSMIRRVWVMVLGKRLLILRIDFVSVLLVYPVLQSAVDPVRTSAPSCDAAALAAVLSIVEIHTTFTVPTGIVLLAHPVRYSRPPVLLPAVVTTSVEQETRPNERGCSRPTALNATHTQRRQLRTRQGRQAAGMCAMYHVDTMSLGVFSFLQTHRLVADVEAKERAGATALQVSLWEQVRLSNNRPRRTHCSVVGS